MISAPPIRQAGLTVLPDPTHNDFDPAFHDTRNAAGCARTAPAEGLSDLGISASAIR